MKHHPVSPERCFFFFFAAQVQNCLKHFTNSGFGFAAAFWDKTCRAHSFSQTLSVGDLCSKTVELWSQSVWDAAGLSRIIYIHFGCLPANPPPVPDPPPPLWNTLVSGGNLPPLTTIQDLTHSPRLLRSLCGPFALIVHPSITVSPSIRVPGVPQNVPAEFGEVTPWTTRATESSRGHTQREAKWRELRFRRKLKTRYTSFLFEEEKLARWPRWRFACTLGWAPVLWFQTKPDQ